MSAKQTEFIAISGWPTTSDYYASAAGATALDEPKSLTLSIMLQGLFAMEGSETEALLSCYNGAGAGSGFLLTRTQSDDYMQFVLTLGEDPDPAETFTIQLELATVIARPLILTWVIEDDALFAYVNGGLGYSATMSAPFTPANSAQFQIGGAENQVPGMDRTRRTGILGAGVGEAINSRDAARHAVACMNAHAFVTGPGAPFSHAWSLAAPRSAPSTLLDLAAVPAAAPLTAVGDLPTIRNVSDVGYPSPRFFAAT